MYQLTLSALLLITTSCNSESNTILSALSAFYKESVDFYTEEPPDVTNILPEYDFIIIGAGTAGCILSNRLTEIKDFKVLLIEAGDNENYLMDIPTLASLLQMTKANWHYTTEPQASGCVGMKYGRCKWPRGKVVGGSSVLHSMMHTRGNRRDYDGWAADGNIGWDFDSVLPYFKKSENIKIPELAKDKRYHSTSGEMDIDYPPYFTPLSEAFLKAAVETGGRILDYNGEKQIGYSHIQFTMRNGTRLSTNRAFLHPINGRKNFHITKNSFVTKIHTDPITKIAFGVTIVKNKRHIFIRASKEIILSAGTINSPQILMLSGIGPMEHLRKFNIPVISDLPVGFNLQDHFALGGLTFLINKTESLRFERIIKLDNVIDFMTHHKGPVTAPSGTEAIAFIDTKDPDNPDGYPDLELLFVAGSFVSQPAYRKVFGLDDYIYNTVYKPIENKDTWMVFPMILLPKSKGRIMLRSINPYHKPLIYANYFNDDGHDEQVILKGIRKVIELSQTKAMRRFGSKLHDIPLPNCAHYRFNSDEYWICAMKTITNTIYHHVGTCKMGPSHDTDAVVDPRLRVYGVRNLRVIDASVMPRVPAAHTNAPTMMIAEKGADMIKEDWSNYFDDFNSIR